VRLLTKGVALRPLPISWWEADNKAWGQSDDRGDGLIWFPAAISWRDTGGHRDLIYEIRDRFISALRLRLAEPTADFLVGDPNEPIRSEATRRVFEGEPTWTSAAEAPGRCLTEGRCPWPSPRKTPRRAARVRRHELRFMC